MNAHTPWRWRPARTNELTMRIEAVSAALNRMVDGRPGFQLSPSCGTLRKGFSGGYCFARVSTANNSMFHETPKKDKYSHPHDALQYLVLSMAGADLVIGRETTKRDRPRVAHDVDYDPLASQRFDSPEAAPMYLRATTGAPGRHLFEKPRNRIAAGTDYDIWGDS